MGIIKEDRAVYLGPVSLCLGVRRRGIEGKDLARVLAEKALDALFIVLQACLGEEDKGSALPAVIAVEDRLFVVNAPAVGFIGRLGESIAVDRHVVLGACFAHELFGGNRAQIGDACSAVARLELLAAFKRLVQQTE